MKCTTLGHLTPQITLKRLQMVQLPFRGMNQGFLTPSLWPHPGPILQWEDLELRKDIIFFESHNLKD